MVKIGFLSLFILVQFLFSAGQISAKEWPDPNNPYTQPYKVGKCVLVDTKSEMDSKHVYTLNPDYAGKIGKEYQSRWLRDARCDELQFHIDRNTSLSRLNLWLDNIAAGWYKNIGKTHFKNKTVSTTKSEWFYVDGQGMHRIPDWLTGLSWGLIIGDRISIPVAHTDAFYKNAPISSALRFEDGKYAKKIKSIWKNNNRDFSNLPKSMDKEITLVLKEANVFEACGFSWYSAYPGNPWKALLNWDWMKRNPKCPLASLK